MSIREQFTVDASQYRAELRKVERETEQSARKMSRAWKGYSESMESQTGSINNLRDRIKTLTDARDKFADPGTVDRYNRRIQALTDEKKKLEGQTVETGNKVQGSLKKIGTAAKLWIAGIAVSAFMSLRKALGLAQEIQETANTYEAVLGPAVDKTNTYIEENARLLGLTDSQAKRMITTTTNMAMGMDFTRGQAANLSTEILTLAGDLQSFNDIPIEQTQQAIERALTGEREALKTLGIVVRETEVQQRALANTGLKAADSLTQQHKAAATLEIITERAGLAVGHMNDNQFSNRNISRQVASEWRNIWEVMSSKLNPALETGLGIIKPFVSALSDWVETPVSEEIKAERDELNSLVWQITDANTSQEKRNRLIGELQNDYPDFLDNLDAEKVTNEELEEQLQKVNDKYADRLVIQREMDKVMEAQEKRDEARISMADEEASVRERLQKIIREQGLQVDVANKTTEERLNLVREALRAEAEFGEGRSYVTGANEAGKALISLETSLSGYISAMNDAENAEEELAAVQQRKQEVMEILGLTTEDLGGKQKELDDSTKTLITNYDRVIKSLKEIEDAMMVGGAAGSFHGMFLQDASSAATEFNDRLTELHNDLQTGIITQEEYEEQAAQISETYLNTLTEIYKKIKDQLTPEQQKMFKAWFDGFKKSEKSSEGVKNNLDDIADAVTGVADLASAFGDLDARLEGVLKGTASVLRNIQNIRDLEGGLSGSGLAGVMPVIGIAGGLATMLKEFSGSDSALAMELERNRIALERNTEAILREAVVGGGTRQEDVNRVLDIIKALRGNSSAGDLRSMMAELAELFPDMFEGLLDEFMELPDFAIEQHAGFLSDMFADQIEDIFSDFAENFGEHGESVAGAIQTFRDAVQFGAIDTQQALEMFVQALGQAGTDIPQHLLDQLAEIDLSSEAGQAALQELIKTLYGGMRGENNFLGDISPDEYRNILDFLEGLADGSIGDGSGGGFSRSVQIARTITDIQANEMIVFLEWIGTGIWELVSMAGGDVMSLGSVSGNGSGGFNFELPLPVRIENWEEALGAGGPGGVNNLNLGNINIDGGGRLSDQDIEDLTTQIANELRRELRGTTF